MYSNDESDVKPCLIFLKECVLTSLSTKKRKNGRGLLNKYDAVLEKIVDHEELMKCIKYYPVIYVHNSKDLKIAWKEKMHGNK